jgi:hypothetical protein
VWWPSILSGLILIANTDKNKLGKKLKNIQGVSEIRVLILTGNRTRQKEQLAFLTTILPKNDV